MEQGLFLWHLWISKVIATAHAHKSGAIFFIFQELSTKNKSEELRPNMTKIASRGPAF